MRSTPRATASRIPSLFPVTPLKERTMHMRRVRFSALLIGLVAILALVAAGCGGSRRRGRRRRLRRHPGRRADLGQAGRRPDVPGRCRRRLRRPRPELLHVRLPGAVLGQPAAVLVQPRPARQGRRPTSPRAIRQISEDKKEITVKLKTGIKYAPPVDREVKSEDVKYAIERAFSANVPVRLRDLLLRRHRRRAGRADQGRPADLGYRDAGRADARHQARPPGRPSPWPPRS